VTVAGPPSPAQATLIPATLIRQFLAAQNVAVGSGRSTPEQAKAAVVRIICFRK
jgi:tagatose-1,6-bisphosphate aldolase non-catalytic subunit AgaZ/GatZ